MNKEEVVPQWCSNECPAWFDSSPWTGRQSVFEAAGSNRFKELGIRLAGIWRVKEFK